MCICVNVLRYWMCAASSHSCLLLLTPASLVSIQLFHFENQWKMFTEWFCCATWNAAYKTLYTNLGRVGNFFGINTENSCWKYAVLWMWNFIGRAYELLITFWGHFENGIQNANKLLLLYFILNTYYYWEKVHYFIAYKNKVSTPISKRNMLKSKKSQFQIEN